MFEHYLSTLNSQTDDHALDNTDEYDVAILVKADNLSAEKANIQNYYIETLQSYTSSKGFNHFSNTKIIVVNLPFHNKKRLSSAEITENVEALLYGLEQVKTKFIYCTEPAHFTKLTGLKGPIRDWFGYPSPCTIPGYEHMIVIAGLNYRVLMYRPDQITDITRTLQCLYKTMQQIPSSFASQNITNPIFITNVEELHAYRDSVGFSTIPVIAVDIETFSLETHKAGIGTFGFTADLTNPVVIAVDSSPDPQMPHEARTFIKDLLYYWHAQKSNLLFWNATFDLTILIYDLFMNRDYSNKAGLHKGLRFFFDTAEHNLIEKRFITHTLPSGFTAIIDGMIEVYATSNTCSGNELSLKYNAQEYAGHWAQENIKDITKIPLLDLMRYNAIDVCATFWTYFNKVGKSYPSKTNLELLDTVNPSRNLLRVQNNKYNYVDKISTMNYQLAHSYRNDHIDTAVKLKGATAHRIFYDSIPVVIQMQLTGMPVDPVRVKEVHNILLDEYSNVSGTLKTPTIEYFEKEILTPEFVDKKNAKLKNKKHRYEDHYQTYNPSSSSQTARLLYECLNLPVLETTTTGAPSTNRKVLEKLLKQTTDPEALQILQALVRRSEIEILLTNFIPRFEAAVPHSADDPCHYIHGSFKICGTVSGRLSSLNPNMQNFPMRGDFAKLMKSCIKPPPGYVILGADFKSLEDKISALTTRDPAKMAVYLDGYDAHCLRAFHYFRDQMPDIENTVQSINSIKQKYPKLRELSKTVTFAMTYQGTWHTLVKNCGFTEEEAKKVENNYKNLYQASIKWVDDQIAQAQQKGYVELAFGHILHTPFLQRSLLLNHKSTTQEAKKEKRTAGNALGQSWGLLNSRAAARFMYRNLFLKSQQSFNINLFLMVHDSIYILMPNDPVLIQSTWNSLSRDMQWQKQIEIYHPDIHMDADAEIYSKDFVQSTKINV